jgi:DNA-directed RNA polymerase specialized sigma24 family protein
MSVSDEDVQKAFAVMQRQAKRLSARGLPAGLSEEDLCSAGGTALARAAREFDPDLGFPFEHYAARCMRTAMLEEIRKQARRNKKQQPLESEDEDGRGTILIADASAPDPAQEAEARELLVPTRKRSTVVLTQVRAATPAAAQVGQMVERLRLAMFGGISEQDVSDVMHALVERAKEGNVAAARLLLDHIAGGRSGCTVQQAVIVNPPPSDAP